MKRLLRGCMAAALGAALFGPGCSDNEKESGITGKENSSAPAADYAKSLPGKSTTYASPGGAAYPGAPGVSKADPSKSKPAEAAKK